MKDLFVPYKQAITLNKLGFEIKAKMEIFGFYLTTEHSYPIDKYGFLLHRKIGDLVSREEHLYLYTLFGNKCVIIIAPLYQQAIKWLLYEVPNHSIRICYNNTGEILNEKGTYEIFHNLNECVQELIKIVKNKRKANEETTSDTSS